MWWYLEYGWFKLNSDGLALGNLGKTGGGGQRSLWRLGLKLCYSFIVELSALRDGLILAKDLGITCLYGGVGWPECSSNDE